MPDEFSVADATAPGQVPDEFEPGLQGDAPSPRAGLGRRRFLLGGGVLLLLAAGGGGAVALARRSADDDSVEPAERDTGTALATVERRTLTAKAQFDGTLGYAGDIDVVSRIGGTLTAGPAVGQVVAQGDVAFGIENAPVVLLYGTLPAYRDLPAGASTADLTGTDIQQLNAALVALGYATAEQLDATSTRFTSTTRAAVKKLQKQLGIKQTGTLTLGQIVFVPQSFRVTSVAAAVGEVVAADAVLLTATSTIPVVTLALDAARQSEIAVGQAVEIRLPDNTTTNGVVWTVGTVAATDDQGAATLPVTILLADASVAGGLDEAPVLVSIITATADNAIVVPVAALLALAGGGYAVEVEDDAGTRTLVPVTVGLFDGAQGLVEVTDTTLEAGQRVVVPA